MHYLKTALKETFLYRKDYGWTFCHFMCRRFFWWWKYVPANQASQLEGQFSMLEGNGYFGFILAVLVGAVIIVVLLLHNVTEKIVPFIRFICRSHVHYSHEL